MLSPSRWPRVLAIVIAIAAPAVVVLLSVRVATDGRLLDFRPFLNDEVYYWHQIATASTVGLNGGYYTVEERTAPIDLFRFGPHGPVFPLAYGAIARVAGWHRASAPFFNLGWLAACTAVFLVLTRLEPRRVWLLAAVLATFWPIAFWASSNMQESFHQGLAIALAGALLSMERRERAGVAVAWIALALAIVTRLSWAVLLPALCILSMKSRSPARLLMAGVTSAALLVAAIALFSRIAPPMPSGFQFLRLATMDDALSSMGSNLRDNARRLVDVGDDYDPLEIVHRVEYVALTIVVIVAAAASWFRNRRHEPAVTTHLLVQASNLGGIVAAMMLLYLLTNWTEHRVISAHVLLAVLVLIALPGRLGPVAATLLVAANVVATPVYLASFREIRKDNFVWDRRPLRVFEETVAPHLRYDRALPPWCNTLLSSQYPPYFIGVPPGIGISITRETDELPWPPRSRYLLFDAPTLEMVGGRLRATPLASVPYGTLYLNLDAACP